MALLFFYTNICDAHNMRLESVRSAKDNIDACILQPETHVVVKHAISALMEWTKIIGKLENILFAKNFIY